MTATAVDTLRADQAALLDIGARLTGPQWEASSGCPGWSVKDLVSHLGALYWLAVDPAALPDTTGLPTEQAQAALVAARRGMPAAEVLADYESVSARAVDVLASLAGLHDEVPLGDLGRYPARLLPSAYSFDHYTHIRADLFAPRGPLPGPVPPASPDRLGPVLDWIEAALPQQNTGRLGALSGTVLISLDGPGDRVIQLGQGEPAARISSAPDAFVRWVTQRGGWAELRVQATGDEAQLSVARALHVF
ncbi:MAG TPA: maleylpyruvate isomerase family mycothiol-dependent enzyme [Streptosporangiaceae bacterium]|nr:maleylpyruvate isomerase family mycothiol-dependent enzyme [Streptosporangiaceae bacterium]